MEVRKSPVGPMAKRPSPLPRWKLVILLSKERSNDWQNYGLASRKICHAPLVFESWYWFSLKIQAKGWGLEKGDTSCEEQVYIDVLRIGI